MAVPAGEYRIGPEAGRLLLRTFRQGMAARAGHDLVIEATGWEVRVTLPADPAAPPTVSVRVDLSALRVREGTGGVKPLTDGDRRQIEQTMRTVLQADLHPYAVFTSTYVRLDDRNATVDGGLALVGQTHPLRLEVRRQGDRTLIGTAAVVQSRWGIKPYSGFFGALKLRDAVDIEVHLTLPVP